MRQCNTGAGLVFSPAPDGAGRNRRNRSTGPLCARVVSLRIQRRLDGALSPGKCLGRGCPRPIYVAHLASRALAKRGQGINQRSADFLFSLLGWAVLAHKRDRSILVVAGLYGTTAAMNGLHPDWGFGYAYPARFLVTALPALVFGLALALPLLMRQPLGAFLAAFALAVSLETIVETLPFPEVGYNGRNLLMRIISDFYPFSVHFLPKRKAGKQSVLPVFLGPLSRCGIPLDDKTVRRSPSLVLGPRPSHPLSTLSLGADRHCGRSPFGGEHVQQRILSPICDFSGRPSTRG